MPNKADIQAVLDELDNSNAAKYQGHGRKV
jgi:hypothetical protein